MPTVLDQSLPRPLLAAAGLVGVEALLLVLFGLVELTAVTGARVTMGVTTTLFFLVYGAGLAGCAWVLAHGRSWARAPVVLAQLIQLGVAWSFRGGASTVVAVALAAGALVVLVLLFHPASTRALAADADAENQV